MMYIRFICSNLIEKETANQFLRVSNFRVHQRCFGSGTNGIRTVNNRSAGIYLSVNSNRLPSAIEAHGRWRPQQGYLIIFFGQKSFPGGEVEITADFDGQKRNGRDCKKEYRQMLNGTEMGIGMEVGFEWLLVARLVKGVRMNDNGSIAKQVAVNIDNVIGQCHQHTDNKQPGNQPVADHFIQQQPVHNGCKYTTMRSIYTHSK